MGGLFVAAGYVTTFGMLWEVLLAGGVFLFELAKRLLGLLSLRKLELETIA